MWIELSKSLPYLLYPLSITLILMIVGLAARVAGARRTGATALVLSFVVLVTASNPWVAEHFRARLEQWYEPIAPVDAPHADAIVVLGGGLQLPLPPRPTAELSEAGDRVLSGARLYRAGKAPVVIVTGGNVFEQDASVRGEGHHMAALLEEWGVPSRAIIVEAKSRNTRENAVETAKILEREGLHTVLLVTSAAHMPRALATFKGAGINAVPMPTDYTVDDYRRPLVLEILPSSVALDMNTQTFREHLGILVYGARGWLGPSE